MNVTNFLEVLWWTGTISTILLLVLFLSSLVFGHDWDIDLDLDLDTDTDGSVGIMKSILIFIAIGSFTIRAISLNSDWSWTMALFVGLLAGAISIFLLAKLMNIMLRQDRQGNWHMWQAKAKIGKVTISIPENGVGRVVVQIDDVSREINARSLDGKALPADSKVLVMEAEDDHIVVALYEETNSVNH
jgi:membrane protein implicated in regulation of membrane protease activity